MYLQEINQEYRDVVNRIFAEEWNCPPSISRGKAIDTNALPGFPKNIQTRAD
jgi:hypothetical protein